MPQLSRTKTILYLTFLVFVWGINWPLSKYALNFISPLLFAGLRTLFGGLLLVGFALRRMELLRLKKTWHMYLISSFFNIILFYGFQTIGLQYMPAGLFSAIVFLQPVLLGLFSWLWLGETMYSLKMVGLVLGFVGVAFMSSGGMSGEISLSGILFAIATAVSWALGTVYIKRISVNVDSVWLTAMQLTIGGLVMLICGLLFEDWSGIIWSRLLIYDISFISTFVIALGWLIYFILINTGEASTVASYTFLIPLVSVSCSVLFFQEQVSINLAAGLLLIVLSIALVNYKRNLRSVGMEKSQQASERSGI
jgi:O-acetylserine/cysteine efflux transporter